MTKETNIPLITAALVLAITAGRAGAQSSVTDPTAPSAKVEWSARVVQNGVDVTMLRATDLTSARAMILKAAAAILPLDQARAKASQTWLSVNPTVRDATWFIARDGRTYVRIVYHNADRDLPD